MSFVFSGSKTVNRILRTRRFVPDTGLALFNRHGYLQAAYDVYVVLLILLVFLGINQFIGDVAWLVALW